MNWYGKPYYSLDAYCKNTFREKLYKIALDAGMTCPNRDGKIDTRGCIFCSAGGSGEFAAQNVKLHLLRKELEKIVSESSVSKSASESVLESNRDENMFPVINVIKKELHQCIQEQLQQGKLLFQGRKTGSVQLRPKNTGHRFIAYFQSYTNTYAHTAYLYEIYRAALMDDSIMGISIATRPDCISEEICHMLDQLRAEFSGKFIWIELGLQTIHEATALYIRRGYSLSCFDACIHLLHQHDIPVIIHMILGLPGETADMVLDTIHYLNTCHIQGIKLQLLHILKGTDLCTDYENNTFEVLSQDAYIQLVIQCLAHLSPDIVIHRVTGDGPKSLLVAPLWSSNKRQVLNMLHQEMKQQNVCQGDSYHT